MLDASVPFGGYKLSGFGRDMGKKSLDSYLETKLVFMAL
jgi:phenylacetaldehyde dehydrogenase